MDTLRRERVPMHRVRLVRTNGADIMMERRVASTPHILSYKIESWTTILRMRATYVCY
jgi:hypothetical protein